VRMQANAVKRLAQCELRNVNTVLAGVKALRAKYGCTTLRN